MFEEYSPKAHIRARATRYFLIIPAAIAFAIIVGLVAGIFSIRSGKETEQIRRLDAKRQTLLDSIRVGALESGFLKRNIDGYDFYVPVLTVLVSNVSSSTLENLDVIADFESEGKFSCQGSVRIFRLGPGAATETSLKCIEPTGFGALISGILLSDTIQPVSFRVRIYDGAAYATVEQGRSVFGLLGTRPPILGKE